MTIKFNLKTSAITLSTLLALLVLMSTAFAGSTTITSLPYTASQRGTNFSETLYVAGTKLVSNTNGIDIRGHDIVLYLGADTVTFGAGNGNSNYGLRFYGSGYNDGSSMTAYNIKIIGGTILHAATNDDAAYNKTVNFSGGSNIYFENTNIHVKGNNAHCLERPSSSWGLWNIEFNGGSWTSDVTGFTSRCQYDGAAARLYSALQPVSGDDYHFKIHGVNLTKSPGQGMIIQGKCFVYDCELTVDARNDFYTYPSGGVCANTANSFAIITQKLQPGSAIYNNVIRSGEESLGCDGGILLQLSVGSAESPVEIYDNDVILHRGHDQYYWDLNSKAFKSRYANKHVNIHDNRFVVQVGNTSNSSYGVNGTAVDVVSFWDSGCDWPEGRYPDSFLVYENNYIEVQGMGSDFETATCARFAITNNDGYTWEGAGNVWRNNHLKVLKHGYQIGGYDNWGQCMDLLIEGDTVEYASNSFGNTQYAYNIGFDLSSLGNKARNVGYLGNANYDDVNFVGGSGERTITMQNQYDILVLGNNECPVAGASITVTNNYGRTVMTANTNSNGYATGIINYWFAAEDGPDSTNFNNFTIRATRSGETEVLVTTIDDANRADTLRLDTVEGDCDVDIVPPGDILDLNALPGESDGVIELSWTAPGDDGNSGQADHYQIRYSQSPIHGGNWDQATLAANPPSPASPGSVENHTISGLDEGEAYYIAVKTFDDVDLESGLSNIAEGYAHGIAVPVPMATVVDSVYGSATLTAQIVDSYHSLYYVFELDSLEDYPEPQLNVDLAADTMATVTYNSLSENVSYFWRVAAIASDGADTSAWSISTQFNILTGVAQTLASSDCAFPQDGDAVQSSQPVFKVNNLPEIDTYYFQVDQAEGFSDPVQSGPVAKSSGLTTSWQVSEPLDAGNTYYWRVSSNGMIWTAPIAFTAELDIHPYPNPFRPEAGHNFVTFTNLVEQSDIVIATLSGKIVKHENDIGPDEWQWDVKNDDGDELAPGVYLYSINFPSGSTGGKVVVIR